MKFRTEISITDAPKFMAPERRVVLMGSCFADNIGARMLAAGWPVTANPCGTVYNPASMAILFQLALTHRALRRDIIASGLTTRDGHWASWLTGALSLARTPEECIDKVSESIDLLEEGLENADTLILTFGTSDVWLLKGTDRAVGNCHKHPAAEFDRSRLGIEEIFETWKSVIEAVRHRNPGLKVVLTVSPRRYLSDGFAENTRQKAVLILACERLCRAVKDVSYFPAYEILNDDLRDYRFYARDLLHPSDTAIDYVWEKFIETYLDKEGAERLRLMEKKARIKAHRPIA